VADDWLFETAVRLHRPARGTYSGLKPAGLDEGPVVPVRNGLSRPVIPPV